MSIEEITVLVKRIAGTEDLPLPTYLTSQSAGMDIHAAVDGIISISHLGIKIIPTGLIIALPEGFEAQIRPRSGLATKYGITIPNTPATIDADYRGEIKVPLINFGKESFSIERGMRIAQMLVVPIPKTVWKLVEELPPTERDKRGFNSTNLY